MKNFFQKLLNPTKAPPKAVKKFEECKHHNYKMLPFTKSNETCLDCGINMCYICGTQHIDKMCTVHCNSEFQKEYYSK